MSKRKHYSQDELKAMFGGDDTVAQQVEMLAKIEEESKAKQAQNKAIAIAKRQQKEKEPTIVAVPSDMAFCQKSTMAFILNAMRAKKESQKAVITASDTTITLQNEGEKVWRYIGKDRSCIGKKLDMVFAAAEGACKAWHP